MSQAPWKRKNGPYVIAEIGSNHDGEKNRALDLISQAAKAGADAVKFQLFRAETLVLPDHPAYASLAKVSTPREWLPELAEAAASAGVGFSATPFDLEGVGQLAEINPAFIKVASSDLTFVSLLRRVAGTGLPVIMSSGMADLADVEMAISELKRHGARDIGLMHCVSMYPPSPPDMNLRAVAELARRFDLSSGLSDHTPGSTMSVAACALGGIIFEKHVTDDRRRPGADHGYALEMDELKTLVKDLRDTFDAMGDGRKIPKGAEPAIRVKARRGLYAARDLTRGEVITEETVIALRPTSEINAEEIDLVLGRKVEGAITALSPLPRYLLGKD
jgi:sialic acid synthase SpsE